MSEADARINGAMAGMAAESGKSYGAMKGGGGGDEGKMNELYKINQVYYRMMPTLSLVSKRTLLVNQAQKTQYTGVNETIIYNFNTGEYYISAPSSYLYMQIGYNNPTAYGHAKAMISQGNLASLFEEVTFTTASGTEVCRELNKGLHEAFSFRYNNTQEYIDTIGAVQGAPTGSYSMLHDGTAPVWATEGTQAGSTSEELFPVLGGTEGIVHPVSGSAARVSFGYAATNLSVASKSINGVAPASNLLEFCLPLDQVLGLFKPYLSTLFPAGALSGGRLEIRLKDPLESLQFAAAAIEEDDDTALAGNTTLESLVNAASSGLTIQRTYLVLDSFQLQDNVLKRLNEVSAGQDGLTVLFDTYDQVITPFTGTGSVECQVQQARSRIVRSWCVVRDNALIKNPYVNSLAAEAAIKRVCAKMGAGSLTTDTKTTTGNNQGIGGGITLVAQMSAPTAWADGLDYDGKSGAVQFLWQKQPPLPIDPYLTDWGKASVSSYQAQLGSLFFPQQPITSAVEHYQNALYVMGKGVPDKDNTCSVTIEDFYGGTGNGLLSVDGKRGYTADGLPVDPTDHQQYKYWVAPYGLAIYGVLAEKSQALQLSGLPISNARLLRHKFTFAYDSVSGKRLITTFTQFTRVMKVFLGGRVVVRE